LQPKIMYVSYNKMQIDLWDRLEYKVSEKITDSRIDMINELI
jgi:hypothetical protein